MTLEKSSGTEGGLASRITIDTLPYNFIAGIQQRFADRIFNPEHDPSATDRLLQQREEWRNDGVTTVFANGVYDMLHLDHAGYLLHTKASGAAVHYNRFVETDGWHLLSQADQLAYTRQALSEKVLRLIVSIDADKTVSTRKGNNPEKGGAPRPILAWRTRALMVAEQSFIDPIDTTGERELTTVDAVTMHGVYDFAEDSPHHSTLELAAALQPDTWVIFGETESILKEAPRRTNLSAVELRCIYDGEGTHYFEDDVMGKMSTTKMTQRILGRL